jgi:hypothetical protein
MKRGLYLIAGYASAERRIATETQGRLGATRKVHFKRAAENAAIGWLAAEVRRLTGRPHHIAVAQLAGIIVKAEISEDRVVNALRVRKREWRQYR